MVRRVGFGDDGDDHRRQGSRGETSAQADAESGAAPPRPFVKVFLTIWIVVWTIGMGFAARGLLGDADGSSQLFLTIWLIFASIAWIAAFRALRRVMKGLPIKSARSASGNRLGDNDEGR